MATTGGVKRVPQILREHEKAIQQEWLAQQIDNGPIQTGVITQDQLREETSRFLRLLAEAMQSGSALSISSPVWDDTKAMLEELSSSRAEKGFTPTETATFVFSLKQPIFNRLRIELEKDASALAEAVWGITELLDGLGLYSTEMYQKGREAIITRQQHEMLELSTPVIRLWDGILAVPLIGTLDSARTQIVMEALLEEIVSSSASIAIVDITGVPTVDTLVAQHLLKTVAAARLMGAECIISGIRPQIAQTIVHLGVELGAVITKSTLADAFKIALQHQGLSVIASQK